ncbi:helix-turn-helix domain-containing protein [Paraburkholderia caledonica]
MIKNDRQYKITAAQARKFELAISNLHRSDRPADLHPLLWKAQLDALQSQYEELSSDLKEYEVLKSHRPSQINAATLEDLPAALIRARIALDLSQAELARRTGLKEQQIQRYEATNYESATLTRLSEIAKALGVRVAETVFLPQARLDRTSFLDRLSTSGISVDWLTSRLLPPELSTPVEEGEQTVEGTDPFVARSISIVERVFGWDADRLMGVDALKLPREAASLARFKVPAHAEGKKLSAYVVYAHYLAMVIANASRDLPLKELDCKPASFLSAMKKTGKNLDLAGVVDYLWDVGVPVIPLNDSGAFHGACWRVSGRNVIVVKQRSLFESRWLFDLLHEYFHTCQSAGESTFGWIEDADLTSTRRVSAEEQAANRFAADVLLGGKAEVLVAECVDLANGNVSYLKRAVMEIASRHDVSRAHLANYLAYRLSLQKINWWGAAGNLQHRENDPYVIVRDVFFKRFDFARLDEVDRQLLRRALTPSENL